MGKLALFAVTVFTGFLLQMAAPRLAHADHPFWSQISGCATWITQDVSGNVYTASCSADANKGIYKRTGSSWTYLGVTGVQVSAYDSGSLWVRKSNGTLYYWNGTSWTGPVAFGGGNACSTYIAAASNNKVWALGCEQSATKSIWRRETNGTWTSISGGAVQIGVVQDGTAWILNGLGASLYWTGSSWSSITGTTNQLTTGASYRYAAKGIDNGWLYRWNGSSWNAIIAGPGTGLGLFTGAESGASWAIDTSGNIYQLGAVLH
jgi:hypothetical protein